MISSNLLQTMKTLLALLVSYCFLCKETLASSCEDLALKGNCTFYPVCLEKRVPCGDGGYGIGFAHKYCVKFTEALPKFNDAGKVWVNKVRACLTSSMFNSTVFADNAPCDEIASFGFASHPQCYVESGFCAAVGEDVDNLYVLFSTISLRDLIRPQITSAMQKTLDMCSEQGYNLIVHDIKEIIQKIIG